MLMFFDVASLFFFSSLRESEHLLFPAVPLKPEPRGQPVFLFPALAEQQGRGDKTPCRQGTQPGAASHAVSRAPRWLQP